MNTMASRREIVLEIGYESTFLANLIAYYLFEKAKDILNQTTYHIIYNDDGLVVFNGTMRIQ